jgi:hypothetical protein
MAGLVPAIHVFSNQMKDVDARDKRGHDEPPVPASPKFADHIDLPLRPAA